MSVVELSIGLILLAKPVLVGWYHGSIVFTAKSPQAMPLASEPAPQACVELPSKRQSLDENRGYAPEQPVPVWLRTIPSASATDRVAPVGPNCPATFDAAAAMRNWWFRYEPPNAAWKKWSATTYFGAPRLCRYS